MYLKELSINGFKSFAKKGEFEFSSSITAIVGPNGSGKSNVAESFRFVLGEQSVKSMRGKRGEDLIWGGSEKIARGNRAAAEVVFDNSSRTFALDFDEIKIERVVHRDGQNEYKINGSVVRLKDVQELLANANIGSTGHHIISQGEADRILSAGPKDRREMIEDALGLKVYQIKKQEADRKLNKTLENIGQVESLRREAAPHLRYLKKQVERAERSLQVQEELKKVYVEYLRREDTYIAKNQDRLQAERKQPSQKIETIVGTIQKLKEKLDAAPDTDSNTEALEKAQANLRECTAAWQEANRVVNQIEGQLSFLKRKQQESSAAKVQPQKMLPLNDFEALIEKISAVAERVMKEGEVSAIPALLRNIVTDLKDFIARNKDKAVAPVAVDLSELETLEKQKQTTQQKLNEAEAEKQKAEHVLSELQSSKVTELESTRQAEKELFNLLDQRRQMESVVHTIDSELKVLERDRTDFKDELQEAVALIGRGVMDYCNLKIHTADGRVYSDEELAKEDRIKQRDRRRELEKLKIRLEELGVGDTEELLKEYKDAKERDEFLEKELSDLNQSVDNLQALISEMQTKLEEQFLSGIDKITIEFDKFFKLMFGGGSAKLDRVKIKKRNSDDEEDEVVDEGVELNVSLPNKRVKGLEMLSGGERALTSIALIFAMSQVNPPPFIILDETDAALDEANSRRYGDMIEALSEKSQLVLITHNRETMSRAGILYGITMGADGVSKVLSVKFDDAVANAK